MTDATEKSTTSYIGLHDGMEATTGSTKRLSKAQKALVALQEERKAQITKIVDDKRRCKSVAFAKCAQICAKLTAPLVTVPSVLVRELL